MSDEINYQCILQFDDQDPKFAYGFQAGQIWTKMDSGEPFDEQFCGAILEMVQRMASRKNYVFMITGPTTNSSTDLSKEWYSLHAEPKT